MSFCLTAQLYRSVSLSLIQGFCDSGRNASVIVQQAKIGFQAGFTGQFTNPGQQKGCNSLAAHVLLLRFGQGLFDGSLNLTGRKGDIFGGRHGHQYGALQPPNPNERWRSRRHLRANRPEH